MRGIFETSLQKASLKDILNASAILSVFISFVSKYYKKISYGVCDMELNVEFNSIFFSKALEDTFTGAEILMLRRILEDGFDVSMHELFNVDLGRIYTIKVLFREEDLCTYVANIVFSYKGMEEADAADIEAERDTARFHALCADEATRARGSH